VTTEDVGARETPETPQPPERPPNGSTSDGLVRLLDRLNLAHDPAGAIYGTIITASTIVAAAEGVHDLVEIVGTVATTLGLYAVAHTYSRVLGGPEGGTPSWRVFVQEFATESAMLTACVVPLAVIVVASVLGAGLDLATSLAVWSAVAMLFLWGLVAARKAHRHVGLQFLSAAALGLVGVAIVFLRVLTGH
jgi:hypothetical protein